MATITLERVLNEAEALTEEEQDLLEELLRHRRAERWRREAAEAGRKAVKDFQSGKLSSESVGDVISRLRELK